MKDKTRIAVLVSGNPAMIAAAAPILFVNGGAGLIKLVILLILKRCGFAAPPLILGMVLSDICENNWRRTLILANAKGGLLKYFLGRPIAIVLLILVLISFLSPIIMGAVSKKAKSSALKK